MYRSPDDLERVVTESLERAQQTISFLHKAKDLFTPSDDQVLARVRGRKPKLTPKVHKAIVKRIKDGCPNEVSAKAAGISEPTFYRWLTKGREATDERDIYFKFWQDIEAAGAEVEHRAAQRILKSADWDWRAAEAFLKRHPRTRGRWGDKEHETGHGVQVIFHRPEMDDSVPSDDLVASDTQDAHDV